MRCSTSASTPTASDRTRSSDATAVSTTPTSSPASPAMSSRTAVMTMPAETTGTTADICSGRVLRGTRSMVAVTRGSRRRT
ncbi:MAG: hypothetical protein EBX39_02565 [Actinobacteria bacterium]|nr:hypothetical protein [Actinomycetota bacterium]